MRSGEIHARGEEGLDLQSEGRDTRKGCSVYSLALGIMLDSNQGRGAEEQVLRMQHRNKGTLYFTQVDISSKWRR